MLKKWFDVPSHGWKSKLLVLIFESVRCLGYMPRQHITLIQCQQIVKKTKVVVDLILKAITISDSKKKST